MSLTVVPTAYGRTASVCLHGAVAAAKHGEPLAPVTVVVPTNSVGVATRRRLASGELGPVTPAGEGVVGVNFLTVLRLAELLGAPRLAAANRRPVSTPVVASAVRRALKHDAGMFAPVAEHPATEEALVAVHRELADLSDGELDALADRHRRTREVVRLHRAIREQLRGEWYDESDLMRAACDAIAEGSPILRDLGAIVCFLPQRWSEPAARLLRALADHTGVTVIAGITGSPRADAVVKRSVQLIGGEVYDHGIAPPTATEVVSVSDADEEVRAVVRGVVDAMRDGVALERMAVLYGPEEPYARLVHEHLELAGIAHNGVRLRNLAETVLGRSLLRMLALAGSEFRRDDVCGLLASAPLRSRGRLVPATEWDRISRKAGVIAGVDAWQQRLDTYAASLGDREWDERERRRAGELGAFVASLASRLDAATRLTSWSSCAQLAHRLISGFFGAEAARTEWPVIEQDGARLVERAVDRLAHLDAIDRSTTLDVFRRTLELELTASQERVGMLGEGLLAGPVSAALGVELERVWVCGLAEGVFPSVPSDDPLLADADRAALGGSLRLRADRVDDAERAFLAALASTSGARVCTWPRGDLRRSTERVPSRFLRAMLPATSHTIASYAQGVSTVPFPATRHELAVRGALAHQPWVDALPAVVRARELITARASVQFTRFDGNLSVVREALVAVSPLDNANAISPTSLEDWAHCPFAYFVQRVLRVERIERPEEIMQLSPLDRGSIMHDVLDRFVDEGEPFDRERLRELAVAACAAAEARGITGRRLLWERDRRRLLAELDDWFDADAGWRVKRSARTLATELSFGMSGDVVPTVELEWADGRTMRMRGKADRIDSVAGDSLVVIDYKTGRPDPFTGLSAENPVGGGEHLQLPVYAYAARLAYAEDAAVEALYWFVGKGNNKQVGYTVDGNIDDVFYDTVRTIADGIEAGVFVARPDPPGPRVFVSCHACEPDGLGTADRFREWEHKYAAPGLAGYRRLLGDEDADE